MRHKNFSLYQLFSLYDFNKGLRQFSLTLLCLFLVACASTSNTAGNAAIRNTAVSTPREYKDSIQLNGRLSVQYQQNEQEQNLSASFEWQQNPQELTINLNSPLGQTIAKIRQNSQGAFLEQAKQETRTAPDIEQLLAEVLGWTLPINGLKNWLQGYDMKQDGALISVPTQDDYRFVSQGWQLRYATWHDDGGMRHPKRIDLARSTAQIGEIKIRIVIDE
jgi:outer membrane lipoprotein LolB